MRLFKETTRAYLESSFKKADLDAGHVEELFQWLTRAPRFSTIRVNKNLVADSDQAVKEIQAFLNNSYESLRTKLVKLTPPKAQILSQELNECVYFDSTVADIDLKKQAKSVVVDLKAAQALLRGADLFIPGIIGLSMHAKTADLVSVYADNQGKCLKGSDADIYIANHPEASFIGNGWLLHDRDTVFKQSDLKSGVGVKMGILNGNYYIPSLNDLDSSRYFLQNLPSMLCAKVLDPQPGQLILDMCSAPGGKTTHIAELVNNKSRVLAFDKINSKIERMKELCRTMNATCIECQCVDATKIDFSLYVPETFDRILVDAPCSALGQRPLIFNEIDVGQLKSYVVYQRKILENAVKLLKPGGILVYSTCTITLEENEEQVSWLLQKFTNLELINQAPFKLPHTNGLKCDGLTKEQLEMVQRFSLPVQSKERSNQQENAFSDTNGFFISKFQKLS